MFAFLGFAVSLAAGLYFTYGGIRGMIAVRALTGTLKNRDGRIVILITALSVALTVATLYYSPLQIVMK